MKGQWIGQYQGGGEGMLLVDMDEQADCFQGSALLQGDPGEPAVVAWLTTPDKMSPAKFSARVQPVHPQRRVVMPHEEAEKLYSVSIPKSAEVECSWSGLDLALQWTTDQGQSGAATLVGSVAGEKSTFAASADVIGWDAFKRFVSELAPRRYIFRGQSVCRRLRTAFHRTGRADLSRFINSDIPELHLNLSGLTSHFFDLEKPKENGAFFSLVQHHGYPTPLLDWSYSPFVAAYFAMRSRPRAGEEDEPARIFILDRASWCADVPQHQTLALTPPHFSVMEFLPIENKRLVPQQALSTMSNLDDIEGFIDYMERRNSKNYLTIVEIPRAERARIVRELTMMGVTAGALFPGIDGTCEEIKERLFDGN